MSKRGLPEGWEKKELGKLVVFVKGKKQEPVFKKEQYKEGMIPHILAESFDGDYKTFTTSKNGFLCNKDDIVMIADGSRSGLISTGLEGYIGSTITKITVDNEKNIPKYIYHFLMSKYSDIQKNTTGGTIPHIDKKYINSLKIIFPKSPTEQQKIVDYLDKQFGFIDNMETEVNEYSKKLDELEKGILEESFSGINGELLSLEEIIDVRDGTHDSPKYVEKGFPLVTSKNLKHNYIDINNVKYITELDYNKINERSKVEKGDMLFAMIGTIGNPTIIDFEPNFAIKNVALFRNTSSKLEMKYLRYYLLSDKVVKKMKDESSGGIQSFVSLGYLRKFKILFPDINTQKQIAYKLDKQFELIHSTRQEIQKQEQSLKELRKAMLNDIFGGFE